ncbi:MAG: damage-inducible protein DinB [Bryobacteraceae bacterium]|nr:damage-inducible protein DinB [Bryobacteraceae bacterium]
MTIAEMLLPEFDQEMANTRKTLERVPMDKPAWKPHEKSMTMGRLAQHIAEMPGWTGFTLGSESLDLAPPGGEPYQPAPIPESSEALLAMFDKNVSEARAAIAAATDEQMAHNWSLLMGGNVIFTLPKSGVIRSMILNHLIHHRAQLTVYLRLNDVAVPGLYGPSADEMNLAQSASS